MSKSRSEQIALAYMDRPDVTESDNPIYIWNEACKWADANPEYVPYGELINAMNNYSKLESALKRAVSKLERLASPQCFTFPCRATEEDTVRMKFADETIKEIQDLVGE